MSNGKETNKKILKLKSKLFRLQRTRCNFFEESRWKSLTLSTLHFPSVCFVARKCFHWNWVFSENENENENVIFKI